MFNDGLIEFIDFVYSFFNNSVSSIGDLLGKDILGLAQITGWSKAAWIGRRIFEPAAYVIAAICFVIEFFRLTIQAEILKWQNAFRCFFLLIVAKAGIDIAGDFLVLLYQMCVEWIGGIVAKTANLTELYLEYEVVIQNMGIGEVLISLIVMGIPLIVTMFITVMIQAIALGRCFEITVYYAVSPIPFAFLPLAGNGTAGRVTEKFIMSFIASCFHGVLIMVCLLVYSYVAAEIISTGNGATTSIELWTALWNQLISAIILAYAIIKSSSWASKIFE